MTTMMTLGVIGVQVHGGFNKTPEPSVSATISSRPRLHTHPFYLSPLCPHCLHSSSTVMPPFPYPPTFILAYNYPTLCSFHPSYLLLITYSRQEHIAQRTQTIVYASTSYSHFQDEASSTLERSNVGTKLQVEVHMLIFPGCVGHTHENRMFGFTGFVFAVPRKK